MNYEDALTIDERIKIYEKNNIVNHDFVQLQNWLETRGILSESDFRDMLKVCEITAEKFNLGLKVLDKEERIKIREDASRLKWVNDYKKIISYCSEQFFDEIKRNEEWNEKLDLSASLIPFILYAKEAIVNSIEDCKNICISSESVEQMLEKTASVLMSLSIKTLVWELHSTETINLEDDENNSNEKFIAFVKNELSVPEKLISFYEKYPVVARRVTEKCIDEVSFFGELISRIDRDYFELKNKFGLKSNQILDISCDEGDIHQKGRFVVKIEFEGGKIVYKPRNLMVEKAFNTLIGYLNKNTDLLEMHTIDALYKDEYTYQEYISYVNCSNADEVRDFYIRFGQLSSLIYILSGNDIHFENLIAHGGYPVIVDVETLFQQFDLIWALPENAFYKCYAECLSTVTGTGMVPVITFNKQDGQKGIDVSALNGDEQVLPYKVLALKNVNTDKMHFEYLDVSLNSADNIPKYNGEKIDYTDYIDEIIIGFTNCIKFIYNNKELFTKENGLLEGFKDTTVRQLLKATQNYVRFMEFSSHPKYSDDMLKLERMFSNIWNYNYRDKRVIRYEMENMLFGDVPIFFSKVNSRHLITASGETIEEYFDISGFERVTKRIEQLSNDEIKQQIAQIKVSVGAFEENIKKRRTSQIYDSSSRNYLELAENIGSYILEQLEEEEKTGTINSNNVLWDDVNSCWKIRPLDQNIWTGLSGLFIFFLQLSETSSNVVFAETAQKLLTSIMNLMDIGYGFRSWSNVVSTVYALLFLNRKGDEDSYSTQIRQMVKEVFAKESIEKMGFVDGRAGLLKILTEVYKVTPDEYYLHKIDYVMKNIKKNIGSVFEENNLGFCHGLSGIYYALGKGNEILRCEDIETLRKEILERIIGQVETVTDCSWENGIAGIIFAICKDVDENIISNLYKKMNKYNWEIDSINYGVCGGTLAFTDCTNDILKKEKEDIMNKFVSMITQDMADCKKICTYSIEGYESVGLLNGLCGVGYLLLLMHCDEIPNVFTLS